ncbi:MAG: UDP-glucose 4-epimerase [Candidatus Hinthialibacteria bacterium OLB16]|nr:MAG: UDP-glucose 4-epimerase [Candidatus Hinthialibacteria bacterium OLB16]
MSTCLVTGCAGFIGSHVCEALLAKGLKVIGIDCLTDFYPAGRKRANLAPLLSSPGFQWIEADLYAMDLPSVLAKVDRVFHLAARAGVRSSWGESFDLYIRENMGVTQRLLEACRTARIERFVNASSSSVYGNTPDLPAREDSRLCPASPYGVTKLAAEKLCDVYRSEMGVPAVSLRLFTVFGPRQRPDMAFDRFIRAGLSGDPIHIYGDGSQVRNFTYVSDVADAFLLAAERECPSGVYNIGGGCTVRLSEVLAFIEESLGRALNLHFEPKAAGDVNATDADTSLAHHEIGFSPKITWKEGILRQIEWIRNSQASCC